MVGAEEQWAGLACLLVHSGRSVGERDQAHPGQKIGEEAVVGVKREVMKATKAWLW